MTKEKILALVGLLVACIGVVIGTYSLQESRRTSKNLSDLKEHVDSETVAIRGDLELLEKELLQKWLEASDAIGAVNLTLENYIKTSNYSIARLTEELEDVKTSTRILADQTEQAVKKLYTDLQKSNQNLREEVYEALSTVAMNISIRIAEVWATINSLLTPIEHQIERLDDQLNILDNWMRDSIAGIWRELDSLGRTDERLYGLLEDLNIWRSNAAARLDELLEKTLNHTSRLDAISEELSICKEELVRIWSNLSSVWVNLSSIWVNLTTPVEYSYWRTVADLEEWLRRDNTSEKEYIPIYHDCDDFAIELAIAALRVKKLVFPIPVLWDTVYYSYFYPDYYLVNKKNFRVIFFEDYGLWMVANHMVCLTYVETMGWVLIEPQTDEIALLLEREL